MDLREFRDTLLRLDRPEEVLQLADTYLTHMAELGDEFILPKKYEIVKPVLEYYSDDLEGWVKFVRGVRDRLPMSGRQYHPGVNALLRKLEIRLTQQKRRDRLDSAVTMAVRKSIIESNYDAKVRYAKRCTQAWKMRRDTMLKNAAMSAKTNRLSVAERELLLSEFWQNIEAEIQNGELPKP